MANNVVVAGKWKNAVDSAAKVVNEMRIQGYETQLLNFGEQIIVQCRNTTNNSFTGVVKKAVGMSAVSTLKLARVNNDDVFVETAGGQWLDKAAVMSVSMIVLWPLFITSGIGMILQNQTTQKLRKLALQYLNANDGLVRLEKT